MSTGSATSTPAPVPVRGHGDGDSRCEDQRENESDAAADYKGILTCWWWEITGAVVSAVCMGLVLVILGKADGLALDGWRVPIQPNSLISVFTTVGKSALMVSIAGCLSQLAWQHFASQPRSLDHIRVFDDASRGPWGAMELLVVIGRHGYLARLLAVATVLALGIEPFAQQILEFGNRDVEMTIPGVEIGIADTYRSRAFQSGDIRDNDIERLSRSVIRDGDVPNAILGVKTQPYFHCPPTADHCTYPAFTTLSVCSAVTDLAGEVKLRYEKGATNDTTYLFTWPDNRNLSLTLNKLRDPKDITSDRKHEVFILRIEPTANTTVDTGLNMTAVRTSSSEVLDGLKTGRPPKFELLSIRWFWCLETYTWTNASSGLLVSGQSTIQPLELVQEDSSGEWLSFEAATEEEPCGKPPCTIRKKTHSKKYSIDRDTNYRVWQYMSQLLPSRVYMNTPFVPPNATTTASLENNNEKNLPSYDIGTDEGVYYPNLRLFLYTADLRVMANSISSLLSNYIRSNNTSNATFTSTSDNANATTVVGSAWVKETYIEVRWPWLVLPLAETVLAIILLVATIVSARISGVPVLGSSPLGLLFHGLERGKTARGRSEKSRRRMVGVARGMEVKFTERDGGRLGFVPIDQEEEREGGVNGVVLRDRYPEVEVGVDSMGGEGKSQKRGGSFEKDVTVETYEIVGSPTSSKGGDDGPYSWSYRGKR